MSAAWLAAKRANPGMTGPCLNLAARMPTDILELLAVSCLLSASLHFRPQRHYWVELGGLAGRVNAEKDAHGAG